MPHAMGCKNEALAFATYMLQKAAHRHINSTIIVKVTYGQENKLALPSKPCKVPTHLQKSYQHYPAKGGIGKVVRS